MMRAQLEGIARFKQEPDLAEKVIKKTLRLDDDSLAKQSWELFAEHRLAAPYPNIKGMKTSYEYVALTRREVHKHKAEEFLDSSFVEELDKSGFIKKLYETQKLCARSRGVRYENRGTLNLSRP